MVGPACLSNFRRKKSNWCPDAELCLVWRWLRFSLHTAIAMHDIEVLSCNRLARIKTNLSS